MFNLAFCSLMAGFAAGLLMFILSRTRSSSMKALVFFISGTAVAAMWYFADLEVNMAVLLAAGGHMLGNTTLEK